MDENERPIFKASWESQTIEKSLLSLEVGDVRPYEELSALVGRDVTTIRHAIESARRRIMRDHSRVFSVLRGVGLKRLSDGETVDESGAIAKRGRNSNRKAMKVLDTVTFENLPEEKKPEYIAAQAQARIVDIASRAKSRKALELIANGSPEKLPLGSAISKLFRAKEE